MLIMSISVDDTLRTSPVRRSIAGGGSLLLHFDVGSQDHLRPLLGLLGDELAEVGGRAWKHRCAHVGEPRLDLRVGESRVDLLVEFVDDLGGVFLGAPTP